MNHGPTLSIGATGQDVLRLQRLLVELKLLPFDHIDGTFGTETESAVKDFQQGSGLTNDGIVGTQTWSRLPADPHTPRLSVGATGNSVSALQKGLKAYAAQNPAADPGPIDGVLGHRTEAAVRAYQSDRGVRVDGVVGDRTWWVPAGGWSDVGVAVRGHYSVAEPKDAASELLNLCGNVVCGKLASISS